VSIRVEVRELYNGRVIDSARAVIHRPGRRADKVGLKVDLKKIDACSVPLDQMARRSSSGAPSAVFMIRYSRVWSQYSSAVDQALKTANE